VQHPSRARLPVGVTTAINLGFNVCRSFERIIVAQKRFADGSAGTKPWRVW
jgi:hypothetical protein